MVKQARIAFKNRVFLGELRHLAGEASSITTQSELPMYLRLLEHPAPNIEPGDVPDSPLR